MRKRTGVFGLILILLLISAAPSLAASSPPVREWPEGWSRETPIGDASPVALRKQAIAGEEGRIFLFWAEHRDRSNNIMACIVRNGRMETAPYPISTESGDLKNPRVAKDHRGGVYIVWQRQTEDRQFQLRLVRLDASGAVIEPDRPLLTAQSVVEEPEIVVDSARNLHIFWGDWQSVQYQLCYMKLSPDGNQLVAPHALTTGGNSPGRPVARFDPVHNQIHLLWTSITNDGTVLWHGRLTPDGRLAPGKVVGNWFSGEKGPAGLATDSQGKVHVVWTVFQSGGGLLADQRFLMHTLLNPDGSVQSAPQRLKTGRGNPCWPSMAMDGSANLHIVWSDNKGAAFQTYYAIMDSNGEMVGMPVQLDISASASMAPQIEIAPDGNRYVFWTRFSEGMIRASISMVETLHPATASFWRKAGLDENHPLASALYNSVGILVVYVMPFLALSAGIPLIILALLWFISNLGIDLDIRRHGLLFSLCIFGLILLLQETPLYFGGKFLGAQFELLSVTLSVLVTLWLLKPWKRVIPYTTGAQLVLMLCFMGCQIFFVTLGGAVAGIRW